MHKPQARYVGCARSLKTSIPSGNNSSLCVLIAINGTWDQLSLAIRTSAPKMSTKKVIVMILHAVQNRIHVSVPVAVHVERTCSEYMCARGLYPWQLDYTQDFQPAGM